MWLEKAFDALGLAAEFGPAAATYIIFLWLDRKSSDEARASIATWTRGDAHRAGDLTYAIVSIFDRIYSHPIFSFRVFRRSMLITTVTFLIYFLLLPLMLVRTLNWKDLNDFVSSFSSANWLSAAVAALYIANVLSDYLSLFIVRRCLVFAGQHLIASLSLATLSGLATVVVLFAFWVALASTVFPFIYHATFLKEMESFLADAPSRVWQEARPALIVQMWLPLLAVGVLSLRVLQVFLYAVGRAQWFLRGGSNHPIEAAGLIAAILVFMGTGFYQFMRWAFG
jgi:hypothetical protein